MNILIVDDELIIREWFRMTVDKLGEEYNIIGEASNGEEALAFCSNHPVNLVVTDVKMPGMDGLELIKRLKDEHPGIRSVIFSSYNEFHFAVEALKFGASEYVLKAEITLAGLAEILHKVRRDLELERSRALEVNSLRHVLNQNEQALRAAYFRELLLGSRQAVMQFAEKMDFFRIGLTEKNLTLLALGIIHRPEREGRLKIGDPTLLQHAVINVLNETLMNETGGGCAFFYDPDVYLLLVNASASGMKSQRELLLLTASRVLENLQRFLGIEAAIGIGMTYGRLAFLPKQLDEALEALDRNWFYGDRGIAYFQDGDTRGEGEKTDASLLKPHADALAKLLEENRPEEALAEFERLRRTAEAEKSIPPPQIRTLFLELIYKAVNQARRLQVPEDKLDLTLGEAAGHAMNKKAYPELADWTCEKLREVAETMEACRVRYAEPVEAACRYIRQNYAKDIPLREIAGHVHLSRTYFSELFKKETGLNFNEYLMQIRMERAKEILEQRQMRVSDVAMEVGYANASYFIKLFRKYVGVSPYEYMERQGGRTR
ncbi:response regulator transcription factor [Paenibacillus macerans]|uniref:response regulator transcription factor n=1 Tax=Paenibacillus macerans TaxID=44252 RepID=UPI003D3156A7